MIERYREWYEHEKDCDAKMIAMIESVPHDKRADERFARAVQLAHHLAACRENWLDRMANGSKDQTDWWPKGQSHEALSARFAKLEAQWTEYLATITDDDLERDFEFPDGDGVWYRWSIEGQIVQLVGHAFYHRGQIAMLDEMLGGETDDTDYLFWAFPRNERYGVIPAQTK